MLAGKDRLRSTEDIGELSLADFKHHAAGNILALSGCWGESAGAAKALSRG